MPQNVAPDHFSTGVWAATGPLRLRHYTCVGCGARVRAWAAFQAHRLVCPGTLAPSWATAASWRGTPELHELLAAARAEAEADAAARDAAALESSGRSGRGGTVEEALAEAASL